MGRKLTQVTIISAQDFYHYCVSQHAYLRPNKAQK